MDKLLTYAGRTDRGVFNFLLDYERDYLTKTAAEYHPTIAAHINAAKKIPGKTQVLLTALGASEFWGFNSNSDAFPEDQLAHEGQDYGYKTFEHYAKVFKFHVNKDPQKSYGDVALSVYNPIYHRVELIIAIDNERAPDIVEKIEAGENVFWSMGTKIPYDICSICGNKAPNRKFYCDHLKYQLGTVHQETGRAVYAINIKPKFFDISYVIVPADKTAITHRKVAFAVNPGFLYDAHGRIVGSAEAAEKEAAQQKAATIVKEVPAGEPPASQDLIDNPVARQVVRNAMTTQALEPKLPNHVLDTLCHLGTLPQILSTLTSCAIALKPQEFQRVYLVSRGMRSEADHLDKLNVCFDPSRDDYTAEHMAHLGDEGDASPEMANLLMPYFGSRSNTAPLLVKRIEILLKTASQDPRQMPPPPRYIPADDKPGHSLWKTLAYGAAIYAAIQAAQPRKLSAIVRFSMEHPNIASSLGLGALAIYAAAAKGSQPEEGSVRGRFSGTEPVVADSTDLYDRIERMRERPYIKVGSDHGRGGAMMKRLLIGVPLVHMGSAALQKRHEADPSREEGSISRFIRKNPDLLSGIVVADALLAAHGKGSYQITKPLAESQKSFLRGDSLKVAAGIVDESLDPAVKSASVQDYVSSSLIWPLAVGTGNLPGRIVGSLFDQAALDLGSKLVEKSKQRRAHDAQSHS